MNVIKYTVGPFAENTYLITEGEQALIIDPGFLEDSEYQKLKNTIDDRDLDLFAVVLTHAHVDHVLGLQRVVDDFDLPVYLSEKDRYLWNNFGSQAAMFGFSSDGFSFDPDILPITDEWNIGNFSLM